MTEGTWNCHVWTDDTDTVIARDVDDAIAVWNEHTGEDWLADYGDRDMWIEYLDDKEISIHYDNTELELTQIPGSSKVEKGDLRTTFTATCRAWIRCYGRGFVCSTEY